MTISALTRRNSVLASQLEPGLVVIEVRRGPAAGGVACLASLREASPHMIGVIRSLEILQVAGDAGPVGDVVVVVNVAVRALARRHNVLPR